MTIAGTFVFTSSISVGFTFQFSINIIVQAGGTLSDQTTVHEFYFLAGSLCTFYSGATFIGSETQFFQYTSLPASGSLGARFKIGSSVSGTFSFFILLDGSIQTFTQVTFVVVITGSFTATNTWLGGIVPTNTICASLGGCGLYISSGLALSTSTLSGELDINFNVIIVASNATFELGSVGVSGSFRFRYACRFEIHGTLKYVPVNFIGIFFTVNTAFNFYAGAAFSTVLTITLHIYNPVTNGTLGSGISVSSNFVGPYYASISETGVIVTSTNRK